MTLIPYTQEQLDFLVKARRDIQDDPEKRLSPVTRSLIEKGNFVFDAHCHVFDGDCVNVRYIVARMIGGIRPGMLALMLRLIFGVKNKIIHLFDKEEIIEAIYSDKDLFEKDENVSQFLARVEKNIAEEENEVEAGEIVRTAKKEHLHWLRGVIRILKKDYMEDVYTTFRDEYSINNVVDGGKDLVTVVLGMDLNKGWEEKNKGKWGSIRKSNLVQVKELSDLANKYPVLPFLPLDPRRASESGADNLYTMFYEAFKPGGSNYFGVKIYPALGYLPSDSRLRPIFDICAEKKIPIVTHCGGESVSTFAHPIVIDRDGVEEKVKFLSRSKRAAFLNEPEEWRKVLERYTKPGEELYVNFGHFGSAKAWAKPLHPKAKRIDSILSMMMHHKAFADFSFNISDPDATDNFAKRLNAGDKNAKLIAERCMFGTDFWVVLPRTNLYEAQKDFIEKIGDKDKAFLVKNVMDFLRLK
ncbi:MAG: amidohydrolase [Bacteroidota bacterium]|nr:amidohydrolase [Bacteroidota bacterium]